MSKYLSLNQLEALEHVKVKTKKLNSKYFKEAQDILKRSNLEISLIDKVLKHIEENARVLIHFHPDRLVSKDKNVVQSLLESGFYRTQFETGISNGGLTAFRGGQRDEWEKELFGGVYQRDNIDVSERPKYGGLDLFNFSDGAAPRFGSCYFKLKTEVSKRCSITNKDSYNNPEIFGTIDNFINILAFLLAEAETNQKVLGIENISVKTLIDKLLNISNKKVNNSANYGRILDDYVECQIHSSISLADDIESLVADPSFKNTETGKTLEELCDKYNIYLDWHGGFKVHVDNITEEFRGPMIPVLARKIAVDNFVNTVILGEAAKSLFLEPELWKEFGTYSETLQYIKQLWHVLAYYGESI